MDHEVLAEHQVEIPQLPNSADNTSPWAKLTRPRISATTVHSSPARSNSFASSCFAKSPRTRDRVRLVLRRVGDLERLMGDVDRCDAPVQLRESQRQEAAQRISLTAETAADDQDGYRVSFCWLRAAPRAPQAAADCGRTWWWSIGCAAGDGAAGCKYAVRSSGRGQVE